MKKKFLFLIAALLCVIMCFAGCGLGSYIENGTTNPPNGGTETPPDDKDPSEGQTPSDDLSKHYGVKVYYGNSPFYPGKDEINVVWRNDDQIVRVQLNDNGEADAGELEGEYAVYLEGLPSKYTYDCNDYKAPDAYGEIFITIIITEVISPSNYTSANGQGLYTGMGCYSLKLDGTYRTELDGKELKIQPANGGEVTYKYGARLYEYTPDKAGFYSIVSKVNVYEDAVNPYIDIYNGTHAYKWFNKTLDGGGTSLNGGFTKNFRYEIRIPVSEVGGSFTFAVHAISKTGEFPVYVDFTIKYEGDYSSSYENVRVVRAEEKLSQAAAPKDGESFVWADLGTKVFDNSNYRYNPLTNRYHYYNTELYGGDKQIGYGDGYGPYLMCAIKSSLPTYSAIGVSKLYELNAVLNPGTGSYSNYLLLSKSPSGYYFPDIWPNEEWKEDDALYGTLDYTEFIRTDYAGVCNAYGYCYVTRELMTFLTRYADSHSLYNDGNPEEGSPESRGYYAEEDAMWLFACGFYYQGGTSGLNADLEKLKAE